jgi:hypothetical protein
MSGTVDALGSPRELKRKPSRHMYSRHDAYIQTAPLLCLYGEQRAIASA